jgi:hypothetical protein
MNQATAPRAKNVKTPGAVEPTQPTKEQRQQMAAEAEALEASLVAGGDTEVSGSEPAPAPTIAPDLQAFIAAEIAKGVAKGLATHRKAQAVPGNPSAELPDQSEVNAFEIKKEVLTKQGYVVPHQYPQPAGLPNSLR